MTTLSLSVSPPFLSLMPACLLSLASARAEWMALCQPHTTAELIRHSASGPSPRSLSLYLTRARSLIRSTSRFYFSSVFTFFIIFFMNTHKHGPIHELGRRRSQGVFLFSSEQMALPWMRLVRPLGHRFLILDSCHVGLNKLFPLLSSFSLFSFCFIQANWAWSPLQQEVTMMQINFISKGVNSMNMQSCV